jgi:hypothetical protein
LPEQRQLEVAEPTDDAAWSRAAGANTYEDYVAYISTDSPSGRHIVAAVNAADDLLWAQVDSIGTHDSYKTYLDKFPRGRHVQEAQDNLEDIAWQQIVGGLTIDGLTDFIEEFAAGRHVEEARNALERLQQEAAHAPPPADSSSLAIARSAAPTAPAWTVTASLGGGTDGIPRATNLSSASVPLPRPRPHFLATAPNLSSASVPLPRPRPHFLATADADVPLPPIPAPDLFDGNWRYHTVCPTGFGTYLGTVHIKVLPGGQVSGTVSDGRPIIGGQVSGSSILLRLGVDDGAAVQLVSLKALDSPNGQRLLQGQMTDSRFRDGSCRVSASKD